MWMAAFVSLRGTDPERLHPQFRTQPKRLMASNEGQKDETRCVSTVQEGVSYSLVALWHDSPSPNLAFPVTPTNPGLSTTKSFVVVQTPRDQQPSL